MDIDLVYLWVNGNDPEWIAKRNAFIGEPSNTEVNCKGRYAENEELKYSLRSVELYAPWIRKIFIVTDNQTPEWLDTSNSKIQLVDHTEILPPESLPCFNSSVIDHFLHRIPGLSEHYLYANDDMFINRTVSPDDFYAPDGLPIFRFSYRRPFRKILLKYQINIRKKPLNRYSQAIENAARLVEERLGKYYSCKTHHNIDAYLKSDIQRISELFSREIRGMQENHIRKNTDIQRHLYSYASMALNRGHKKFVNRSTSFHVYIHRKDHYDKLVKHNPMLFCMNDSQYANDEDRERAGAFLRKRFPNKSQFEK